MHMVYLISVSPIQNLAERKGSHCSSFQDNVTQLKYTSQIFSSPGHSKNKIPVKTIQLYW